MRRFRQIALQGLGRRRFTETVKESQVLVLNSGSSSCKFAVSPDNEFSGQVERIATPECQLLLKGSAPEALPNASVKEVVQLVLSRLPGGGSHLAGVGHRIVHGGLHLYRPTRITDKVLEQIREVVPLAPLHNPAGIAGIEAAQAALPGLVDRHVACFDTGFHHDMPPEAQMYGLPKDIAEKLHIRRYGFHGISCQGSYRRGCEALHLLPNCQRTRIIILHLGAGCSATAVVGGRSVDTTMGMTPLDGLMMGTRCGKLDPGMASYICNSLEISIDELDVILNKKSGLLGVSGVSGDMRAVLAGETKGTPEQQEACKMAINLWVYRLSKVIASMLVPLQNVTGIVCTGGIGENSSVIRKRVMRNFAYRGIKIDDALNEANGDERGLITSHLSTVPVVVVKADEESEIARETRRVLA